MGDADDRRERIARVVQALGSALVEARLEAHRLREEAAGALADTYAADVLLEHTDALAEAYGELVGVATELLRTNEAEG